jgi:hypothetical protein
MPQAVAASVVKTVPRDQRKPKLLDQLREAIRSRHYSRRTETRYSNWVKRFIYFHDVRHPADMAEPEINAFLTHLSPRWERKQRSYHHGADFNQRETDKTRKST